MKIGVIGGGLAGLVASLRLQNFGHDVALIDEPLPAARGVLGGFAKFSGAKFSLPPAGLGLVNVTGDVANLNLAIQEVLNLLDLPVATLQQSIDARLTLDTSIEQRQYTSYVLSSEQIDDLVFNLARRLNKATTLFGKAKRISRGAGTWCVDVDSANGAEKVLVERLIVATGRKGHALLDAAGAVRQVRKGIDIGVRVEFQQKEALQRVREVAVSGRLRQTRWIERSALVRASGIEPTVGAAPPTGQGRAFGNPLDGCW